MAHQYKRKPLTQDEANHLANACQTCGEKLIAWTFLDTGLRVSDLANLSETNFGRQGQRIMVYGKDGPYGSSSKRRMIPLSRRFQPLVEGHFALYEKVRASARTIQCIIKRVANRAHISRPVTPHVLRHAFSIVAIQKGISLPALQRPRHDRLTTTAIDRNLSLEDDP